MSDELDSFMQRNHGYVEKGLLAYLANYEVATKAFCVDLGWSIDGLPCLTVSVLFQGGQ